MKNYLLLPVVILAVSFWGCQKDPAPQPADVPVTAPVPADPVDTLVGVYIGNARRTLDVISDVPQAGYPKYDTTYSIDTLTVTKISSKTFKVKYGSTEQILQYTQSLQYVYTGGWTGSGYYEVTEFDRSANSVRIKKSYTHSPTGYVETKTYNFFGIK